jgi:hypothetical protein
MMLTKINKFIEKYNMNSIIKMFILLIILFIVYRLFKINYENKSISKNHIINTNTNTNINTTIETFSAASYENYGNGLTLKNTNNIPIYSDNKCTLEFNTNYRIDSIVLKFNANDNKTANGVAKFNKNNISSIYIQYLDDNNNMRNLKTYEMTGINFLNAISGSGTNQSLFELNINNITDENNLMIYTSKIVISIDGENNKIAEFFDAQNMGYIKEYNVFGGSRKLLSKIDYDIMTEKLENNSVINPVQTNNTTQNINTTTFSNINNGDNFKIYSLKINGIIAPKNNIPSTEPFNFTIKYYNTLYPNNSFTVTKKYKIRNDKYIINNNNVFIFLDEPIIANKLIFERQLSSTHDLTISSLNVNGMNPNTNDIKDFKRYVNVMLNKNNLDDINICPSIDNLLEKQTKTQQICDNLEYQDKVKSEKIRLERNKQYLLKLKNQQEQIDQLNNVIQDIENKRDIRDTTSDQIRVLQYQNQKADASTIRDLANQRLESQDNNKLFLDVNLNYKEQ